MRRAGELLKQIEPGHGRNQNISRDAPTKVLTRKGAAGEAGMSREEGAHLPLTREEVARDGKRGMGALTPFAFRETNGRALTLVKKLDGSRITHSFPF